ncbi:MAG: hypothetical protein WC836_07865 [Desulfobacula sp.]|jgi:hypothetical protein
MEDISRELEREIAKSRPKPFKKNRKIKILIVDDFGKIMSGDKMKIIFIILSFISVVTFITSILYYYRYTQLLRDTASNEDKLVFAEKKIGDLTTEKEMLMARLVILGKEPGIKKTMEKNEKSTDAKLTSSEIIDKNDEQKQNISTAAEKEKITGNIGIELTTQTAGVQDITESKTAKKAISIEKFTVTRNKTNKDLLVQFGVRNTSKEQGDISGRIFTVLKPDNTIEDQWLVVPAAKLINGIPIENQNGQYFSIAHYKPVKFKIKSDQNSDFYKNASIFIFSNEGELVFEKTIDITEAE